MYSESGYHFVRTILSIPFCPITFCQYTILSPYHFVHTIPVTPVCTYRYVLIIILVW